MSPVPSRRAEQQKACGDEWRQYLLNKFIPTLSRQHRPASPPTSCNELHAEIRFILRRKPSSSK